MVTDRNPVEQVSWEEAARWLGRHRLGLPSEAQWERACRAGRDTPWSTGRDVATIARAANVADAYWRAHVGRSSNLPHSAELDDGHMVHAPVGNLEPNGYGLHDVHGNLWEWCQDTYASYEVTPRDGTAHEPGGPGGRVGRSGSWLDTAPYCRSSRRGSRDPGVRYHSLGFRPAAEARP